MTPLFFYGTLCHLPLLEVVLGRPVNATTLVPATLPDHAVYWADGQSFPIIQAAPGQAAQGLLLADLSEQEVARLSFYEDGFGYDLKPIRVTTPDGTRIARVYFPHDGLWQPGAPWSLDDWGRDWGFMTVETAMDFMRQCGQTPPDRAQAIRPFLLARGWARQMAQTPAAATLRSDAGRDAVEIRERPGGFEGFFALRSFDVRFRRFDTTMSDWMPREVFVSFDAALVLPYDPETDTVLLIEQMRNGPVFRGDPHPWVLEPVAGLVDAGEDPAICARREAMEEADIALGHVEKMCQVYAAPGYTTEYFHCFVGLADLNRDSGHIGGLDDEHEDIRSHIIGFDHAMALIDSGEINAGPLVMMLLWLDRHRDRLRKFPR